MKFLPDSMVYGTYKRIKYAASPRRRAKIDLDMPIFRAIMMQVHRVLKTSAYRRYIGE